MFREIGSKATRGRVRPKYTAWRQTTIRKRVRTLVRARRRSYKQYLKTGDRGLLSASQKKITSWNFD